MTQRDILGRAAEALGGADRLAVFLAVPVGDVRGWITGQSRAPEDMVAAAVDVLTELRSG